MSAASRRPAGDARAEEAVRDELSAAGDLAEGTKENYRGWAARFAAWCELNGLVAFPADDETAQLFLHAHYPRWRYSYAKAFPAALRAEHRRQSLSVPVLEGCTEYLRRLSRDAATAPEQEKVAALRVQEADTIGRALATLQPQDPRVIRVRAVVVVSALLGLPLLDLPARAFDAPDLLWAERLPAAAMPVSDSEVRLSPPGGEAVIVDAQRHPVEYAVLRAALAQAADPAHPLAGPPGESRRLTSQAAARAGLLQQGAGLLAALSPSDLHFLLANVDEHYQRRVRDWAYVLAGVFTACRHDELSRFMLDRVDETAHGYGVWVDRVKNHPEGHDYEVQHVEDPLTCTHPLCPACALRTHRHVVRRAHGRTTGPVFATRYGGQWRVMTRQNGRRVVKGLWERAGLPGEARVATRALRAGGITSASEGGWEVWQIAEELSFHQDVNVCEVYVRRLDPFSHEFFLPV
ncbi:hypothetical protein [Geodermatophilus sabuli]|uniref:Site-specific integrase n=1 Tax=Geodermatophilus sabuli TaxID=1564158 RepID=A0A285EBL8_9ACTN|nr:hypothetical protein [Geodermatophilus sabuli]MBB3084219.1 integrase [Geodermatophilus sabuli]SNX96509.1 hypothetical protein SAMN06893097_104224 [Geodermatophilus sabuli]